MSWLLASVRSVAEARIALAGGVDLLDLKEPSDGALGAVAPAVAAAVVELADGRLPVSATLGDFGGLDARIGARAEALLGAGVDVLKLGLFDRHSPEAVVRLMAEHPGVPVVPVAFAEDPWRTIPLARLAAAGVRLLMLDTREKGAGGLLQRLTQVELCALADATVSHGLQLGLAGSLGLEDLPRVLSLAPTLVGLRGALCEGSREGALSAARLALARAAIPREARPAIETTRRWRDDILA